VAPSALQMRVVSLRPYTKNTLRAFVTLSIPSVGINIFDCCLHERDDSKWISLPARPYGDGSDRKWQPVLEFIGKDEKDAFQRAALMAIETFEAAGGDEF
jgi:hypothetical protein